MNCSTNGNTTRAVKVTLATTQEHRYLQASVSFAGLVDKVRSTFGIDRHTSVGVTYIDDEGDRVSVSSDDELACAFSFVPNGSTLRLFIAVTATTSDDDKPASECDVLKPAVAPESPVVKATQEQGEQAPMDAPPTAAKQESQESKATQEQPQEQASPDTRRATVNDSEMHRQRHGPLPNEEELLNVLKQKLAQEDPSILVCDNRGRRLLARFEGDVDKAAAAVRIWWARTHPDSATTGIQDERKARREQRIAARIARKQHRHSAVEEDLSIGCTDQQQAEDSQDERKARREQRIAARIARKQQEDGAKTEAGKPLAVEGLMNQMGGLGFAVSKGKCAGALRRCHGEEDQAKAQLLQWCTARQDREQARNERMERRNERLLARFDGDAAQVEAFLAAKLAKREARAAERANKPCGAGTRPRGCRKVKLQAATSECAC